MLLSTAVTGGKLVPELRWLSYIDSLREDAGRLGFFKAKSAAKHAIYSTIAAAVKKRAESGKKFGVLLSGGVDSSFIAFLLEKLGYTFKCFCVGITGSKDLAAAKYAANELKLKLVSKEFTVAAAARIIRDAVELLKTTDPVTIGIAATEMAALRLAAANKTRFLFSGLGSEEIFAGYQRHVIAKDVHEECWRGMAAMWQRDFLRDMAIAEKFMATALTPFLDKAVIVAVMRARPEWKISEGEKKLILREIASDAGLPKEIAFRPKMAAQYGSGFDKALERLARATGFGNKRDYLRQLL